MGWDWSGVDLREGVGMPGFGLDGEAAAGDGRPGPGCPRAYDRGSRLR